MSALIFCQQDQARGIFIQSVDNPRPLFAAYAFQVWRMTDGCVYQCARIMTSGWMNDHASRFINYHQIIILENDLQWNSLCL